MPIKDSLTIRATIVTEIPITTKLIPSTISAQRAFAVGVNSRLEIASKPAGKAYFDGNRADRISMIRLAAI